MNQELISIIVPIYKVEQYLEQCISSIVNQSYKTIEIILIDDGSPDKCPLICDSWAKKDNRIIVIHKNNGGLSDARNEGLKQASGYYITFVDSDDWIDPMYVESMYRALVDNQAQICATGSIEHYINENKTIIQKKEPFVGDREKTYQLLYDQCRFPVDATPKMYLASIWKDIRFPVGKNYEDAFTTYRTIDKATTIVQTTDTFYNYRIRENSIMTSPFSLSNINISHAWKENYLFCKEKYPNVADLAHSFWLEHIPPLIERFPYQLSDEEKEEKKRLKKEILDNFGFILTKMPLKKKFRQVRALCFL